MFLSALIFLFVGLLAGLHTNYSTDFHKIRWKGGTWATKKPLDFGGHVTLGLGLGGCTTTLREAGYVLFGICSIVTILRHRQLWRRYALY